jgi:hypothetical protein
MEMRRVMRGASFHEHANDDAEEPANLGHDADILRLRPLAMAGRQAGDGIAGIYGDAGIVESATYRI